MKSVTKVNKQIEVKPADNPKSSPTKEPKQQGGSADPMKSLTQAKAPAVDDSIEVPGLCCPVAKADLEPIQISVAEIDEMKIKAVEKGIIAACENVKHHSGVAVKASTLVIAHAWQCGVFLNRAKAILTKKGEFGDWRKTKFIEPGLMSDTTSQRYMTLAKNWSRLEDLLISVPTLRAAYQDCGILPHKATENQGGAESEQDNEIVNAEEALLKEVDQLKDTLRRRGESVSEISEQGRAHLKLARVQIDEIFATLLGEAEQKDPETSPEPPADKASGKPQAKEPKK